MQKFTKAGREANSQVLNHLNLIVEEIKKRAPVVKSIILGGSFGYGEGPVKIINGKAYPYNDYDIYIIVENKLKNSEIERIAIQSANRIGQRGISIFKNFKKNEQKFDENFYVDLTCLSIKDLPKLLPRLKYYKFKKSTKVLYGQDVRGLVPDYSLSAIPLSEGAKLLCDRMSQLVYYYSTTDIYCKENLTYFIQQAYSACCTSLLLLSGKYKKKYSDSIDVLAKNYQSDFPKLYKKIPDLPSKIKNYIDWKLNPTRLPIEDVAQGWYICANDIIKVSMYFFSKFLNNKIENCDDLSSAISTIFTKFYVPYLRNKLKINILSYAAVPLLNLFLKVKYFCRIKEITGKRLYRVFFNWHSPDIIIFSAIPLILNALKVDNIEDTKEIAKALRLLKKVYPVRFKSWEELTLDYANSYFAFFRQKLG